MKKWSIMAVSVLCTAVFSSGCTKESDAFEAKSYTSEGETITSIRIDVRDKEIQVTASDNEFVHMDYYENDTRYYDISVSDGLLSVTEKSDEGIGKFFGIKSSNQENVLSLQIPESQISDLEIRTSNENISLSDIAVTETISLIDNGGNIFFQNLGSGSDITISNKNGGIGGTILGTYEDYNILCDIKKGDSSLPSKDNGAGKSLYVTNNNGNVEIDFK